MDHSELPSEEIREMLRDSLRGFLGEHWRMARVPGNQLLEVAKKEAPIMYRWAKMGSETFVLEKPKDEENKFT